MTTATTRTITAAMKRAGLPAELTFRSTRDGYHLFVLDDGGDLYETRSVYTNRVGDLTTDQWLEEARAFASEQAA